MMALITATPCTRAYMDQAIHDGVNHGNHAVGVIVSVQTNQKKTGSPGMRDCLFDAVELDST